MLNHSRRVGASSVIPLNASILPFPPPTVVTHDGRQHGAAARLERLSVAPRIGQCCTDVPYGLPGIRPHSKGGAILTLWFLNERLGAVGASHRPLRTTQVKEVYRRKDRCSCLGR